MNKHFYHLLLVCVSVCFASQAQVRTSEVIVEERQNAVVETSLQVNGNVAASGTVTSGAQTVNGNQTVNGDVNMSNFIYDFARSASVPAGGYSDFVFTSEFSAGFLVEVSILGILGPSASTMNSEKHVFSFYMYSDNMNSYEYKKTTLYQLGDETANLDVNISAVGSGNKFRVRISNSYSAAYNCGVRMNFVGRGSVLTADF